MRAKIFVLALSLSSVAFAEDVSTSSIDMNNMVAALAGGVNIPAMQQCIASVNQNCPGFPSSTWEQKDLCTKKIFATNAAQCVQTQAIYQKTGMLPYHFQAAGPVTIFTFYHLGDGQESFHMIDQQGLIIDLASDQNPTIAASADFQKIQKENPGAGVMPLVVGKAAESPEVKIPQPLANPKDTSQMMALIFPQMVKVPPCLACQNVATADIAYQFSYPQGNFLGVKWVKTEAATHAAPDVVDEN